METAIRELISTTEEKTFKKSLMGFNKNEVLDYINSLEENYKKADESYKENIAYQSNALAMALREKENLLNKVKELEEKIALLTPENNETKSKLIAENNSLKAQIEEIPKLKEEIERQGDEISKLKARCEIAEGEYQNLTNIIAEKEEVILEQCKNAQKIEEQYKISIAQQKADYDSKRELRQCNLKIAKEAILKLTKIIDSIEEGSA